MSRCARLAALVAALLVPALLAACGSRAEPVPSSPVGPDSDGNAASSLDDRLAIERMLRTLPGRETTVQQIVLGIVALGAFQNGSLDQGGR